MLATVMKAQPALRRSLCTAMHMYTVLEAACTAVHGIHTSKQPDTLSAGLLNSQEGEPSHDPHGQNPMLGKAFKMEE